MRTIVCGASRPIKFKIGAAAIMWWEETEASHVYFYIKRFSGIHLLYQAVGSGTEFEGYTRFRMINRPVYEKEIEITEAKYMKLIDYLVPRLKCKYSRLHLLGLFLKRAALYCFKLKIRNIFADKGKSEVCIEALCTMLESQSLVSLAEDPEDMGMQEALAMLKTMPGVELTL